MVSPELSTAMERLKRKRQDSGMRDDRFSVAAARAAELEAEPVYPEGMAFRDFDAGGVAAKWAIPRNGAAARRIVYFHGGGYITGRWETHCTICAWLAEASAAPVLFVDYRRAPEHPFPAAVDDAYAAYLWTRRNGPDGASPARSVATAGDSSGGALAMAVMLRARSDAAPMPDAGALISAMLDLDEASSEFLQTYGRMRDAARLYVPPPGDPRHEWASPVHADLAGLPPLLVQTGEADYVKGDSLLLAERARSCGLDVRLEVWPEMPHVWHRFAPAVPEARDALERIGEFLRQQPAFAGAAS